MIFLPQPSSLSYGEGTFTIHYDSRIFLDSESPAELFSAAQLLQQEIETQTGFRPAICRRHQPVGSHLIYLTASPELSREAYTLAVTPENITICGSLESGVLYGVQTLRQMIRQAGAVLPTVLIFRQTGHGKPRLLPRCDPRTCSDAFLSETACRHLELL